MSGAGGAFLDPSSPSFLDDPYGTFDRLRPHGPLIADDRGWSVLDYVTGDAVFRDPRLVPGIDALLRDLSPEPLWSEPEHSLTASEGATHTRLHRAVGPWFTPRRIESMRARTRSLVAAQLASHTAGEPFDVMSGLADVVPARLFCWMVGVDEADHDLIRTWSAALLSVFTADPSIVEPVRRAKAELAAYTDELLRHKGRHPGDDLATLIVEGCSAGVLNEADARSLLEELLSASVDNTSNTVGGAIKVVAEHPRAWSLLHEQPALVPAALEELLRYETPIRHMSKFATSDTEVAGVGIPAGTFVTVRLAAAHRDPAVYDNPDRLDLTRDLPRPPLTFGAGRHYCLGAALGRMEAQEMIAAVTGASAEAALADGVDHSIVATGVVRRLPLHLG